MAAWLAALSSYSRCAVHVQVACRMCDTHLLRSLAEVCAHHVLVACAHPTARQHAPYTEPLLLEYASDTSQLPTTCS